MRRRQVAVRCKCVWEAFMVRSWGRADRGSPMKRTPEVIGGMHRRERSDGTWGNGETSKSQKEGRHGKRRNPGAPGPAQQFGVETPNWRLEATSHRRDRPTGGSRRAGLGSPAPSPAGRFFYDPDFVVGQAVEFVHELVDLPIGGVDLTLDRPLARRWNTTRYATICGRWCRTMN